MRTDRTDVFIEALKRAAIFYSHDPTAFLFLDIVKKAEELLGEWDAARGSYQFDNHLK